MFKLEHSYLHLLTAPVPCGLGYFSGEGSANCEYCAPGYFCPTPTTALAIPCTNGTYSIGEKWSFSFYGGDYQRIYSMDSIFH